LSAPIKSKVPCGALLFTFFRDKGTRTRKGTEQMHKSLCPRLD